MHHHPFGDQRATAANDPSHTLGSQVQVFEHHTAVDRHVVDPLLGLVLDHIQEVLRTHILDVPPQLFQHLVDRHGTDRDGRSVDNLASDIVDIFAGRQIHNRIGTVMHGHVQFIQLLTDVAGDRAVADIRINLTFGRDSNSHRLQAPCQVDFIGWNDHSTGSYLSYNGFHWQQFTFRHKLHFRCNFARSGCQYLGSHRA